MAEHGVCNFSGELVMVGVTTTVVDVGDDFVDGESVNERTVPVHVPTKINTDDNNDEDSDE